MAFRPPEMRSTSPRMPPSRTSRLEPLPMIVTGASACLAARSATAISSAEWMFTITSAGPPMRRVVYCAIEACGAMRSGAKLA